jgi:LPS export ABC transporter protein LptC
MTYYGLVRYNWRAREHESVRDVKRIFWIAIAVAGCNNNGDITPAASPDYAGIEADQIVVGMEQFVTESGRLKAVLRGDTAFIFEDSAKAHVKKVDMRLFDEAGSESAHLTSRSGDFNNATQAMVARGNVVLVTRGADPRTIETEELHYDPNTKRVWSTKPTVMRSKTAVLRGTGFTSDERFENVQVTNASGRGTGLKF